MTTHAVCMAMRQLFAACGTDFNDFNIKRQRLTSEWVVCIHNHRISSHVFDDHDLNTVISLGLKLHARFDVVDALEHLAWYFLYQFRLVFAVAISRCNVDGQFFANSFAYQCIFQTRNNVVVTMQIDQWCTFGFVDDIALLIGQRVVERYHLVFLDCGHESGILQKKSASIIPVFCHKTDADKDIHMKKVKEATNTDGAVASRVLSAI